MDMRKFRHALALAETGNFGRAAEQVHLSQPALSRSIQALERELGVRLFDRDANGATPTVVGRQLLDQAGPLLAGLRRLRQQAGELRDGRRAELVIGAGPLPAATLMPPLLAAVQREQPGLHLLLRIAPAALLLELLQAEQIELFVADVSALERVDSGASQRRAARTLQVQVLGEQQGGLFCHRSHALARKSNLTLDDLRGQRFAAVQLPPGLQRALQRLAGEDESGLAPPGISCDNLFLLKDLARHGELLMACTREALTQELVCGEFLALDIAGLRTVPVRLGLVTLAGRTASPAASAFIARLLERPAGPVDRMRVRKRRA